MLILLIVIFLLICIAAFYHGIVIRRYTVESDKLDSEQSLNIVVVSDLHNTRHDKLVDMIREINPDIIAMPGDIVDTKFNMKYVNAFLDDIAKLNIPVYYVTGNHEEGAIGTEKIKNDIRNRGITVLSDEFILIEINGVKLTIAGVNDPYRSNSDRWNKKITEKLTGLEANNSTYKILLAHRPDLWEIYENLGFDLALSGHAHGGQVRIPFILNGLFAPHQGLFPKYAGGHYTHDKLNHIVSRGLSVFWNLPRVFNPPELVHIKLVSNRNTSQ